VRKYNRIYLAYHQFFKFFPLLSSLTAETPADARQPAVQRHHADITNAIRALAMDAVEKGEVRASRHADGHGRDRRSALARIPAPQPGESLLARSRPLRASNGHGSMLQYALLHLTGYDLPMEEIRRFRQLHSKTPGHPEVGVTPGVETTTGPLGQGSPTPSASPSPSSSSAPSSTAPGTRSWTTFTYVFVGDGCLMEGISHEAASLAGTLGLGKLDRALRRQRHLD
jgi:transketolase